MRYEELDPSKRKINVVFGGTAEERDAFQAAFLKNYPDYQTEIHPCLKNYKKPLFGQQPIVDYLAKQAKGNPRKLTALQLKRSIQIDAKKLNVDHLLDRYVPALSERQKIMFSLILERHITADKTVFVRDDQIPLKENDCDAIAYWFATSLAQSDHIVLLTESIEKKIDTYYHIVNVDFYQLEQGELIPFNISLVWNKYQEEQRRQEEAARREEQKRQEEAARREEKKRREEAARREEQKRQVSFTDDDSPQILKTINHDMIEMGVPEKDRQLRFQIYMNLCVYGSLSAEERKYLIDHYERLTQSERRTFDQYMANALKKIR